MQPTRNASRLAERGDAQDDLQTEIKHRLAARIEYLEGLWASGPCGKRSDSLRPCEVVNVFPQRRDSVVLIALKKVTQELLRLSGILEGDKDSLRRRIRSEKAQ